MNERIQQQLNHFRKMVSHDKVSVNAPATTNLAQEDTLSKAIRTEKDGQKFMAELKYVLEKAR